jgi:uncharacterized LabA/DUF88 family protein
MSTKHLCGESVIDTAKTGAESALNEEKICRVHCFVDGFNLYHALDWFANGVDPEDCRRYRRYKWLSLTELARCYVSTRSQRLTGIDYFTTSPTWNTSKQLRHRAYVRAQESEGVTVTLGAFREKAINCKAHCGKSFAVWQEKQTDVNIAVRLVDLARQNAFDRAILISGDSDLIPAIQLVHKLYENKSVAVVVPIGRKGHEIETACKAAGKFTMTEAHLERSQLPDSLTHPDGKRIYRPVEYIRFLS